jgi:hypothetical protein
MQKLICPTLTNISTAAIEQCTHTDPKTRPDSASLFETTERYSKDDDSGWTLLHNAVGIADLPVVNRLIEMGSNLNAESKDGGTPLHIAVQDEHVDVVNRLIEAGVNPKAESKDGWTHLHQAAGNGHIAIVNQLIEAGVNLNAESKDGWTALHLAAQNGHVTTVNRLMEVGADPNHCSEFAASPFHCAVYHGRVEVLRQFLQSSGDPWLLDGFGHNVLDWASTYLPASQVMGDLLNGYKPPDRAKTSMHLTKTIQRLLQSNRHTNNWFNYIGGFLLHAREDSEATIAFEQTIESCREDLAVLHMASCSMCAMNTIQGRRHICRVCGATDLCEACFISYSNGQYVRNCSGHSFLAVPSPTWKTLQPPHINEAGETLEEWVERLKRKWNVPSLDTTVERDL